MKKFAGILLMLLLLCGAALAENTYHVEEFSIEKEDESVIAGWLYVPDGAENAPAVILCQFIIQNLSSGKDITNLKIGFSIDKLKLLC